jgi:hypothetical protein
MILRLWNHKLNISMLTFDITVYLDFVLQDVLLRTWQEKHIPLLNIQWIASFFLNCSTVLCLDGKHDNLLPVVTGILQVSCVSPVLAAFSSPLTECIQEKILEHFSSGILRRMMAIDAAEYITHRGGSMRIVTHPTNEVEYFMVPTQAAPELSARSTFAMCEKGERVKTLMEKQV